MFGFLKAARYIAVILSLTADQYCISYCLTLLITSGRAAYDHPILCVGARLPVDLLRV